MKPEDKKFCKRVIRDIMEEFCSYNRLNVASKPERELARNSALSVIDNLEYVMTLSHTSVYRRVKMYDYCEMVLSRLLGL